MFLGFRTRLFASRAGTRGVVLYLVALLMVPFVAMIGVAVDFGQLLLVKNQLAAAIDAAALDIGATPGLTQAQAQAQAQAYVNANFTTQYPLATAAVSPPALTATTISLSATATVQTVFLKILGSGYNTLSASVSTQVTLAQNYLEVVLVLDNTSSMSQMYGSTTGIDGLKQAAITLVDTLFALPNSQQYVKIGIVPFTNAVNVGMEYATASWIDKTGATAMTRENIDVPAGTSLIAFASKLATDASKPSWAWGGCVRQRTEKVNGADVNYDVQDIAPDPANPDTLFTPFFAPDEPDGANSAGNDDCTCPAGQDCTCKSIPHTNPWLYDGSCWNAAHPELNQKCIAKYTTTPRPLSVAGLSLQNGTPGPNYGCTVAPILRLTNDSAAVLNEINSMYPLGNTVIPAGLMWGWHLLSPNGPFISNGVSDGVPYSDPQAIKVIILVTDGENNIWKPSNGPLYNGFDLSVYNSYGYGAGPHLNLLPVQNSTQDQPDYNLDQKELQLCTNIKNVQDANGKKGRILLYTIGFGSSIKATTQQLLQQCATNNSTYFYSPTSDTLITAFQKIAVGLSKLRIAK